MIFVFMGDEHASQLFRRQLPERQRRAQPPQGDAVVQEKVGVPLGEEGAVAGGAAGKNREDHPALASRFSGSSGRWTSVMSPPRARSLPTKSS